MGKTKDFVLWLFHTNKCTYCGRLLKYGETLCGNCKERLPRIAGARCKFCGADKNRCKCNNHRMRFDGITAPFYYEEGVQIGISRLKFGGKDFLAKHFARDMAQSVEEDFRGVEFDYITFVPLSSFQKQNRVYNQSEVLATELGKVLDLKVERVLEKVFENDTQHYASQNRRNGNVLGVYEVLKNVDVTDKTILLVDDIKTTGATLNECAKILKIRGANKVYGVTVAMTGKDKPNRLEYK
jgi:ComF family protein